MNDCDYKDKDKDKYRSRYNARTFFEYAHRALIVDEWTEAIPNVDFKKCGDAIFCGLALCPFDNFYYVSHGEHISDTLISKYPRRVQDLQKWYDDWKLAQSMAELTLDDDYVFVGTEMMDG